MTAPGIRQFTPGTLVLAVVIASYGCTSESPGAGIDLEARAWGVAREPDLSIGVLDGDPQYQLHQVVGAVRLDDGSIAVMNAGSGELRIYGADGSLLSTHGRKGEGPGEFVGASRMHRDGDTLFIYDGRMQRLSVHDTTGAFIENRSLALERGRFQLDEWLYDRSWIDGPPLGVGRAPVMEAITKLPPPDSVELFRYVRVSPFGQLWVREKREEDAQQIGWRVYDMNAEPIGRVELPARFEVLEFGPDYLLGRWRDEYDVEYVQLLSLSPTDVPQRRVAFMASPADTMRMVAGDTTFAVQRRAMIGGLRMLTNSQEIYYSTPENRYSYATHLSRLDESWEAPEGVGIRIVRANERGWVAVAVDRLSGRMCGVAIGTAVPPGWMPGAVSCQ